MVNLSKRERIGIVAFSILILIGVIMPFAIPYIIDPSEDDNPNNSKEYFWNKKPNDSAKNNKNKKLPSQQVVSNHKSFKFDPNTASQEELLSLGFTEKNINTISNYLQKGGKFYEPEDIKRIYGINPNLIEELMPFILIKSIKKEYFKKKTYPKEFPKSDYTNYYEDKNNIPNQKPTFVEQQVYEEFTAKRNNQILDINNVDSATLESISGIGPKIAHRIIEYRNKLGGYISKNQIKEIWGMNDTIFNKIEGNLSITTIPIKKININIASELELKQHPYIKWNLAKVLFNYRLQHGLYKNINDLRMIEILDQEQLNKLVPYISFE